VRLSAQELKRRYRELRDLVNEWDPQGLLNAGSPRTSTTASSDPSCAVWKRRKRLSRSRCSLLVRWLSTSGWGYPMRFPSQSGPTLGAPSAGQTTRLLRSATRADGARNIGHVFGAHNFG